MNYEYNLSERDAARECAGMADEGFKKLRLQGKIPSHCYVKFGYRTLRYNRELLLQWIASLH